MRRENTNIHLYYYYSVVKGWVQVKEGKMEERNGEPRHAQEPEKSRYNTDIYLSIFLSNYLSLYLSIYLCLSTRKDFKSLILKNSLCFLFLGIYLSIYPSVCLTIYLFSFAPAQGKFQGAWCPRIAEAYQRTEGLLRLSN